MMMIMRKKTDTKNNEIKNINEFISINNTEAYLLNG